VKTCKGCRALSTGAMTLWKGYPHGWCQIEYPTRLYSEMEEVAKADEAIDRVPDERGRDKCPKPRTLHALSDAISKHNQGGSY
jgi:hypothetical protein